MTTHPIRLLLPAALCGLLAAGSAAAQPVPMRLALDIDPGVAKKNSPSQSMARQVAVHLVPMLQGLGYEVTRVKRAGRAIESGEYHYAVSLDVDARPLWLVHQAREYDDLIVSDHDVGVSAEGEYAVYGWRDRDEIASGDVGPIDSRIHESPGPGRPVLDDEDSVARVLAGELADLIEDAIRDYEEPEGLEDE